MNTSLSKRLEMSRRPPQSSANAARLFANTPRRLAPDLMRYFVIIVMGLVLWGKTPLQAAPSQAEKRAYNTALQAFSTSSFVYADQAFTDFAHLFPNSELLPEAWLLQAQSRFKLEHFDGVIELLEANLARAGKFADQYHFWLAEAHFYRHEYRPAAEAYARLTSQFPSSPRALEAAYGEALSRFKLGETAAVIALLQKPDGLFQTVGQSRSNDEWYVRGNLLLVEALFSRKEYRPAEEALARLADQKLAPEQAWERQFFVTRVQQADQRLAEASESALNLLTLAKATGKRELEAKSITLQGEIFEQQNRLDEAVEAFQKMLDEPGYPPEFVRQALLRIIELTISRNQLLPAYEKLTAFVQRYPKDASLDLAHLTLGELQLKSYFQDTGANAVKTGGLTNGLPDARSHFDQVITNFTKSPLLGKAYLGRGWCYWGNGQFAESVADFKSATETLPAADGEERAIALFKWADSQFRLGDFRGAATNYQQVITHFSNYPKVKSTLFDRALYQLVRAGRELGDLAMASEAMDKILHWYPGSFFSDRSMLLYGQALNHQGKPAEARALFEGFLKQFAAHSPLIPEVKLAIGRTYEQEQNWSMATAVYEQWVTTYTNNPALPKAVYDLGMVHYYAGKDSQTFTIYTNFLAQFPTNTLAINAQYWIGSYYYNQQNFTNAEKEFQLLFQNTNWTPNIFTYQSWMMAGRCAVARQSYKQAQDYFNWLITNGPPEVSTSSIPPTIVAQAYFAKGDAFLEDANSDTDTTRAVGKFADAINVFTRITQYYPTNLVAAMAFGEMGNCNLQLATQDPTRYKAAAENYQNVAASPLAGISMRSGAVVGLGVIEEKQARLKPVPEQAAGLESAVRIYQKVIFGEILRDDEKLDPFWVQKAGLEAGRLLEELQKPEEASKLYQRLQSILPQLRDSLEKRISLLRQQPVATKK